MLLRVALETVEEAPADVHVPSASALIGSGSPVVDSVKVEGAEIRLYQNGYVLFIDGDYMTVFSLHQCREYIESDVWGRKHIIPYEAFLDCEWHQRAVLEGDDRIDHNRRSKDEYAGLVSYDGFAQGSEYIQCKCTVDPLDMLIEKETLREDYEELDRLMRTSLTDKQRQALEECVGKGRRQADLALELGVTRRTISFRVQRGLTKLREAAGTLDRDFGRNRYYSRKVFE